MSSRNKKDKNEPAFLRRLKSQHGDGTSGFRHNINNRPKALGRGVDDNDDDDDDAPQYVVEESDEVLTKEQFEQLVGGQDSGGGEGVKSAAEHQTGQDDEGAKEGETEGREKIVATRQKQNITRAGGGLKKRKQGKVIGNDDGDGGKIEQKTSEHSQPTEKTESYMSVKKGKPSSQKTKQKKIKLSLEEEEE